MATRATRRSFGFPPIADTDARVLVLGSLPGAMSLQRQQYYAQPRNAFWPLMGRLFAFEPSLPYDRRVAALKGHKVAVWDVCRSAVRPGSLDASIDLSSAAINDFAAFFADHQGIDALFFNGTKAAALFRVCVLPALTRLGGFRCETLPSTSPAHASLGFEEKLQRWSVVRRASTRDGVGTGKRR